MSNYIKYEKPKDATAILSDIDKRIEIKQESLFLIDKVFKVAEKWNGKQINKRFANDLQKLVEADGYKVYYRPQFGMFHVDIDYKTKTESKFSALIGYDSGPYVNLANIVEYNRCYTLDKGRIEKLMIGKAAVQGMVIRWNLAIKELQAINTEAEKYELEYTFEIDRK